MAGSFRLIVLSGLALISVCGCASGPGKSRASQSAPAISNLLTILNKGDQQAYENYFESAWSAEALGRKDAVERADRLARLYVDTGGLRIGRVIVHRPEREVATADANYTGLPYCIALDLRPTASGAAVSDFAVTDIQAPPSPAMRTPQPPEVRETLSDFMDRLGRRDAFSGVVVVAKDGVPILRRAYGKAGLGAEPVTLDTRFSLASIGKSFTAVLIAQLVDERKLSFDDKVGKFLPDYPDAAVREKVTIRHLLTHTSGLGDKSEFTASPQWAARRGGIRTIDGYLALTTGHPLETEPGAAYSYSNAGFVILGAIIERLTGQSYYEVAKRRIFEPAGMTRTTFDIEPGDPRIAVALTNFVAKGDDYTYRLGPMRAATADGAPRAGSHGGVPSTADDMLRFLTALRSAKLTSPQMAKTLMSSQGPGRSADRANGFGFELISQNGHTVIGHGGGDLGIANFVHYFEPTAYAVVVLSNRDPRMIRAIDRRIRGLLTRSVIGSPKALPQGPCDSQS